MRLTLLALIVAALLVACDDPTSTGPAPQRVKHVTKLGIPVSPLTVVHGVVFDTNNTLLIGTNTGIYSYDWTAERWNKQADSPNAPGTPSSRGGLIKDLTGNLYFFTDGFQSGTGTAGNHFMRRKVGSTVFEPLPFVPGIALPYMTVDKQGNLYAGWQNESGAYSLFFLAAGSTTWTKHTFSNMGNMELFADRSGGFVYAFAGSGLFRFAAGTTNLETVYDFNAEGLIPMDIVSDSNDQIIVLAGTTLYRLNPTLKTYSKIADSPLPLPASMRRIMRDKAGNIYSKVYLGPDVFPNPSYELYKMPVGTNTWQTKPVGITGGGNANFIFDEANDPYIFFNDVVAGTWDIAKILR